MIESILEQGIEENKLIHNISDIKNPHLNLINFDAKSAYDEILNYRSLNLSELNVSGIDWTAMPFET